MRDAADERVMRPLITSLCVAFVFLFAVFYEYTFAPHAGQLRALLSETSPTDELVVALLGLSAVWLIVSGVSQANKIGRQSRELERL